MRIPFNEWLPDQAESSHVGLVDAKNCLPAQGGYRSFPGLSSFTSAIAEAAVAAYWAKASDGLYYNFLGTATKLYRLSGSSTWDDASKVGGYTGATRWEMARFGDRVIAVSLGNATQAFDMGTDTDFADLAGSPPQAATICIVGDFVLTGNLIEGATEYPSRLRWSGYNDTEWWTSNITRQSDFQDLYGEGGAIQRLVPISQGAYVFMERSIQRISYVGGAVVFRIDEIEPDRGTYAPRSVCWNGSQIFYYGHDGFYQFTGQGSVPISEGKVSKWLLENTDDVPSIQGAVDRTNNQVVWTFKSSRSLTYSDRALVYHIGTQRWSYAEINTECIGEQAQGGATLEELDAILGTNIDANAFTVDDPAYQGGQLRMTAVNISHELCTFAGTELSATLETGDVGEESGTIFVPESRVIANGTTATYQVSIGYRNSQDEAVTYSTPSSAESTGKHPHRVKGRYVRVRVTTTGPFKSAAAAYIKTQPAGGRG